MGRRPMCLVCMCLMLAMCLADWLGISFIRGNPLPESVQTWIRLHPEAVICGEVQQCAETEISQSIYLKNVSLLYPSDHAEASLKSVSDISFRDFSENTSYKKVSIENVRVFLKKEKEFLSSGKSRECIPVGTLLVVSGRLERVPETRNPGEFDSRQYYACSHIYYLMKDGVIRQKSDSYSKYLQGLTELRERFAGIFEQTAGEDAPVFEAMALGMRNGLEAETKLRYQMAGIIHILAISGMHISLLGAGLNRILKKAGLGLFLSGMVSLVVMLQYGMMTGSGVAAMRAVCMFVMAVGAELLGRCYDGMTALAVSAILLLLSAPANLYGSGFLLSFGAVVGLGAAPILGGLVGAGSWPAGAGNGRAGICGRLFENRIWKKSAWIRKKLTGMLLTSASVQLVTLPIVLYFYGEVSLAGIFLNLAVLPTVGAVLASGVCGALAGLISLKAAAVFLLPGRALLFLYEKLCMAAGSVPWCTWIAGKPGISQIVVYYVCLALAYLLGSCAVKWIKRDGGLQKNLKSDLQKSFRIKCRMNMQKEQQEVKEKRRFRTIGFFKLVCVLLLCAGIFSLRVRPQKGLTITCLDVGQGDGIVLEASDGGTCLIDCGSSNKSGVGQYQLLPFLKSRGISRLDAILVSHTDEDHISGILELLTFMGERLTGIRADRLILPKWTEKNEAYRELEELANKAGVQVVQAGCQDILRLGKLEIRFLSPAADSTGKDVNEEGMVTEVCYGDFRGFFTGDIGKETEKKLLPLLEDADFLKVAHHGSKYSTGEAFLEKVRPEVGVISCSASNTYGHPAPDTVEILESYGCRLEYTMKSGAVSYWTDGSRYKVSRWIRTGEEDSG